MSRLLEFQKLRNIRDLGGMKTADGRQIRQGTLIRSGHLSALDPADKASLQGLVNLIIDLRTDQERQENPDVIPDGVTYATVPILDRLTAGVTREKAADRDLFTRYLTRPSEAKDYMRGMYRAFAEDTAVSGYARFLGYLLENDHKAVLWHCTAGKDRAGIAAVLIEEILGISREEIIEDYLKTNGYLAADIRYLTGFLKKQAGIEGNVADEALRFLLGADREYITAFYDAVEKRYGSFDAFIREGLNLSEEDAGFLKEKYLTKTSHTRILI